MPSNSDPSVLSKLQAALDDYKNSFEKIYDRAVSATGDVLISQPNNEIRNFVGHLADAVHSRDVVRAELEFVRATRHLRFATYDAATVMLIYREAYVICYVNTIEKKHGKQPGLQQRLDGLSTSRRAIPRINSDQRFDPDAVDRSAEVAAGAATNATLAYEQANRIVALYNNFARELESNFPAEQPDYVTPQYLIDDVYEKEGHVQRKRALKAVWAYAGTLAAVLGVGEMIVLRSLQLLVPIGAVCLAGGLIGTFLAVTASSSEMNRGSDKRNR
jgi:hypothetical protein